LNIDLDCPTCQSQFTASPESSACVVERMADQGAWLALGDGETSEDALAATLSDCGADRCPRCGTRANVSEDSLARIAQDLLATW
jgi:hypothetical protein